jgi:phage N-6-adenine-methyltransferase
MNMTVRRALKENRTYRTYPLPSKKEVDHAYSGVSQREMLAKGEVMVIHTEPVAFDFNTALRASAAVRKEAVKKLRVMPAQKPGRSIQNYATPDVFIAAVKRRFNVKEFYYDLAAEVETSKGRHSFCEEEDSLAQDWTKYTSKSLWLNPPFGQIEPWAKKCAAYAEYARERGGLIYFLTPASIGANWFADHVWGKARVFALQGRLSFDGKAPYPKDCMLSVFGLRWGFEVWDWRKQ